jgi:serine/threonine protein kinase
MAAKKSPTDNIFGEWQAIDQIARGGMGVAIKARHLRTNQIAVLKFLLPKQKETDPKKLAAEFKRFKNEKETLEKFDSKYISKFYDADLNDNPPWIALQYFAGITVWDEIEDNGPIEERKWWELAHDLLSGLQYIHDEKGRVHRDLNPKNVMLVFGGARLIDFGIARLEGADSAETHKFGFPGYTSPEHYTSAADPKNDIFVAATVLAFAGTGVIPWKADTHGGYLGAIFNETPNYRNLSEKQKTLLRSLHKKNPAERPTAAQALKHLETLTNSMPAQKATPSRAIKSSPVRQLPESEVNYEFFNFLKEHKRLLLLGLFTGGWGLLFNWLWRRSKDLPPIHKPISVKIAASAALTLIGYGVIAFIPTFYWSKKLADRRLFWIAVSTIFLSPLSLVAIAAEDVEGKTNPAVTIFLTFILFLTFRINKRVYEILKHGSTEATAKIKAEKKSKKEKLVKPEPATIVEQVEVATDSALTTGESNWDSVESTIFQYLATRKGKQFSIEILSNKFNGIYFQGYSEPGGYITVEAASNISVTPPLEIENRKGMIKIGWEPPSDGLPNFIKFLDLKESENSEIAKLFTQTLREGYLLELGSFKVEL